VNGLSGAALVARRGYKGSYGVDGALVWASAEMAVSHTMKSRRRAGKRQRRKRPPSSQRSQPLHITQHRWLWLHTQLGGTLVQPVGVKSVCAPPVTLASKGVVEPQSIMQTGAKRGESNEVVVLVDADNSANILK